MVLRLTIFICLVCCVFCELCPKQCDCDVYNSLNRAVCVDQNIISIDVGVSKAVQVYSLKHNYITELDNFCFKESGYTALVELDISDNHIFWIGLHAFSGLNKLVWLNLSNNALRFIPSDLFWDVPALEYLDMSSNAFESLKNEPFIMHSQLKILNLNNCRMRSLPERIFNRLPNLRKLDISENYMVTLNTEVLMPLRKLERLELRNDYWQCNAQFVAAEKWITYRGIDYERKCQNKSPQASQKIISLVQAEKEPIDLDKLWNVTIAPNDTNVWRNESRPQTPFERFDKKFSSLQAFVIGVEIGLAMGMVMTYLWLRRMCRCSSPNLAPPRSRRERRRRRLEGDMRASLLWSTVINPDLETPPLYRRELPPPEGSTPYGVPAAGGIDQRLPVDAIRMPDRAETPPPPYNFDRD